MSQGSQEAAAGRQEAGGREAVSPACLPPPNSGLLPVALYRRTVVPGRLFFLTAAGCGRTLWIGGASLRGSWRRARSWKAFARSGGV